MYIRQLETFITVAKEKSFSKAGEILFLTQPTISNHIQSLEKEFKTSLINRSNRKISLTKSGEILYKYAENILKLQNDINFKISKYENKIIGHLEISSSTIPEQYIIPDIIKNLNKQYPYLSYSIHHYDSKEVINLILKDKIDFGFVGVKTFHKQLEFIPLFKDELVIITPNNDKFKNFKEEIDIELIKKEPFILREKGSGSRQALEEAFEKQKISIKSLNVLTYADNTETIKQLVRNELGISLISKYAVKDEIKYGLLRSFKISNLNLDRYFYFVFHKNKKLSNIDLFFKESILDYISKFN